MKKYLRLFRAKHYVKNIVVFTTLIFGGQVLTNDFYRVLVGFVSFCLLSSVIYIINDLVDYEIDKKTKSKKNEPIANDEISKSKAFTLSIVLLISSLIMNYFTNSPSSYIYIVIYFISNVFYSLIGKKIPYLELVIVAMFYLLRVLFGASILNVPVSLVLTLTVTFGALYIVVMKRMAEMKNGKYRKVFQVYTEKILQVLGLTFLVAMLGCYIWWTLIEKIPLLIITIVLIIFIFIRYDKKVKLSVDGNPVEILFQDKILLSLSFIYCVLSIILFEFYL